jgi:uncharacterized membrane protein
MKEQIPNVWRLIMHKMYTLVPPRLISAAVMRLLIFVSFYPVTSTAAMMGEHGMMGGWFMVLCMAVVVLLFVALILAIMALVKYLFPKK